MLKGEKVILRPLRMDDLFKLNAWRNDLDLTRLTMGVRYPITLTMDEEWLNSVLRDKSNRNLFWAICVDSENEMIGVASLTNIDYVSGVCTFGWMIGDSEHRGKGYGSETERLIREYAFYVLNLRKITRYVLSHNEKSLSILKNNGTAKEEGVLKKHFFMDGKYHDVVILSFFKENDGMLQ